MNNKLVSGCIGLALTLGLSACDLMQRSNHVESHYEPMQNTQQKAVPAHANKAAHKSYASKDPGQKATPGPVRKAAPQLPVIQ